MHIVMLKETIAGDTSIVINRIHRLIGCDAFDFTNNFPGKISSILVLF